MSDENKLKKREDRPTQEKPEAPEHKAQQEQPRTIVDLDQRAPRGRRPLFRS